MIVEDEMPVRAIVRSLLQRLNYTVFEAANGAEAMRILLTPEGKGVELLITDLIMPEMGGKELVSRTRASLPQMRVVFISGYPIASNEELAPGALLLRKPFSPKDLAETVRDAFRD